MKRTRSLNWKLTLFGSALAILIGMAVREGVLTSDSLRMMSGHQDTPGDTKTVEELPSGNSQKPSEEKRSEQPQESPIQGLKRELSRNLNEEGFTAYEVDTASRIMLKILSENVGKGLDSNALAVDAAAKELNLDDARKDKLRKSLFESFNETGGAFTAEDFKQCIEKRVVVLKIGTCAEDLAERFSGEILSLAQGYEKITLNMQREFGDTIRPKYVKMALDCGLNKTIAERLFAPMLSDCPNQ